jgi:hypothetical protein
VLSRLGSKISCGKLSSDFGPWRTVQPCSRNVRSSGQSRHHTMTAPCLRLTRSRRRCLDSLVPPPIPQSETIGPARFLWALPNRDRSTGAWEPARAAIQSSQRGECCRLWKRVLDAGDENLAFSFAPCAKRNPPGTFPRFCLRGVSWLASSRRAKLFACKPM